MKNFLNQKPDREKKIILNIPQDIIFLTPKEELTDGKNVHHLKKAWIVVFEHDNVLSEILSLIRRGCIQSCRKCSSFQLLWTAQHIW